MKKINIRLVFSMVLMWGVFTASGVLAQEGDPPPPPGGHGSNSNAPPGGGAPVGSGVIVLVALGAAYGGKKVYDFRKRKTINRKPE